MSPKRVVALLFSVAYLVARRMVEFVGYQAATRKVTLTYHTISAVEGPQFERQMRRLRGLGNLAFADDPAVPTNAVSLAVTFDDALQQSLNLALPILRRYDVPVTVFVPTGYVGEDAGWMASEGGREDRRVASADFLRGLDSRFVRLGSHTVSHPRLARLSGPPLREELASSKEALERLTGAAVRDLALPFGSWNEEVLRAAKEAGYERVFSNVPVASRWARGWALNGRVDTSPNDTALEFRLKAVGAYQWMAAAVPLKRGILTLLGARPES